MGRSSITPWPSTACGDRGTNETVAPEEDEAADLDEGEEAELEETEAAGLDGLIPNRREDTALTGSFRMDGVIPHGRGHSA
jgi:hypothetical protein